ncbi:ribosome-releasing factor 2, mitochondrial [Phlebotomus papatasi]|uniref:ribosome-releasing factor 2, mitochondrial n=1 Tax=Phlebotomus papatasi TaxID=29031 RepID=UPI0024843612|nr:ribosome-releasing factor 2, mitochondrial [Phlebotomus papatasi]
MSLSISPRILSKFKHLLRIGPRRHFSKENPVSKTRNIGILAHIDAGKTTTTERMLFYSGKTRTLGEVHHGNTVTDFLDQERERGITICSAAVTFPWDQAKINLIDTPGHIDFTMEVELSLGAVDAAVVILDASAGVEAQTLTVWSQADRYSLPRIVFVNKMDRDDADFLGCLEDLKKNLKVVPVPLQIPIKGKKELAGIVDVVRRKLLTWNAKNEGLSYKISSLPEHLSEECEAKRAELIDCLSGLDDDLAEIVISRDSLSDIDPETVQNAIRRATISRKIVPVLMGSAYKNTGVQTLLDAVVSYFPNPCERYKELAPFEGDFIARVFKIMHDKQRGPLTLFRVLSGSLKRNGKVTTGRGGSEVAQKIYEPLANEYREIEEVSSGDIGICAGLKTTKTGDLLVGSSAVLKKLQKKFPKALPQSEDDLPSDTPSNAAGLFSVETKIPDAVYFCSVEPPSLSQQKNLDLALMQLQREDPSLKVRYDETTFQTVLGGMGELHLDIVKSRILSEYKVDAMLGPLQIAYRESLDVDQARDSLQVEKDIAGSRQRMSIELSLRQGQKEKFIVDTSKDAGEGLTSLRPRHLSLVKKGILAGLERGPKLGGSVVDTYAVLHDISIGPGAVDSFIIATAAQCVQKILREAGCRLLEPIMSLEIIAPGDLMPLIVPDLSRRRATILDMCPKGEFNKQLKVHAPLAELSNYSSSLRILTSGRATFFMEYSHYAPMTSQDQEIAIKTAQGLM